MSFLDIFKVDCRRATFLHEQKQEGKLTQGERIGIWIHMAYCTLCRRFIHQVSAIENKVKTMEPKPVTLDSSVKNKMQTAFNDELKRR